MKDKKEKKETQKVKPTDDENRKKELIQKVVSAAE